MKIIENLKHIKNKIQFSIIKNIVFFNFFMKTLEIQSVFVANIINYF